MSTEQKSETGQQMLDRIKLESMLRANDYADKANSSPKVRAALEEVCYMSDLELAIGELCRERDGLLTKHEEFKRELRGAIRYGSAHSVAVLLEQRGVSSCVEFNLHGEHRLSFDEFLMAAENMGFTGASDWAKYEAEPGDCFDLRPHGDYAACLAYDDPWQPEAEAEQPESIDYGSDA